MKTMAETRPIRPSPPHMGRIQIRVRRHLVFAGKPLTTSELARLIYPPPIHHGHRRQIREAARKFAIAIGRRRRGGCPTLWALKP
jgi:hypothetical protein